MNRLLQFLFAMLVLPQAARAVSFSVDNTFYFNQNGATTVSVKAYSTNITGDIVIPSTVAYNGTTYNVTTVESSAFRRCNKIVSVSIPEGVTSIGESAFYYCSNLTDISIPEGVTSIGESAFYYCSNLTDISIPEGVTSIGKSAFSGCSNLTNVSIPSSVTAINSDVFYGCKKLSLMIPSTVTSIGNYAFYGCLSAVQMEAPGTAPKGYTLNGTTVQITPAAPASGYNADNYPTMEAKEYNKYRTQDSEIVTSQVAWGNPECIVFIMGTYSGTTYEPSGEFTPEKFPALKEVALQGATCQTYDFGTCFSKLPGLTISMTQNTALTSITIPDNVTGIGNMDATNSSLPWYQLRQGFYGCTALTAIDVPANITSIGPCAFQGCSNATTISIPESVTTIGSNVLQGINKNKVQSYKGPVEALGNSTFQGCTVLKEATLHTIGTATAIPTGCFANCTNLEKANIPSGITTLEPGSFYGCASLAFIIPADVTVRPQACYGCKSAFQPDLTTLTGITYDPSTRTATVADQTYASADKMKAVSAISGKEYNAYQSNESQIKTITSSLNPCHIVYKCTYPTGTFAKIDFPSLEEVTLDYQLDETPEIASVDLKACFGTLGDLTVNFSDVANVKSLSFPGNIAKLVFRWSDDTKNKRLKGLENLTFSSAYAFRKMSKEVADARYGQISLQSTTIEGMGDMPDMYWADDVRRYGFDPENVCYNSLYAKKVIIGKGVTSIGHGTFWGGFGTNRIEEIDFSNATDLKVIHGAAFRAHANLKKVVLPPNVERIEDQAFSFCSGLEEITLNEGLKEIDDHAFTVTRLQSLHLPSTLEKIGIQYCGYADNQRGGLTGIPITVAAGNTHFRVEDNMLMSYDRKTLYGYYAPTGKEEVFVIPDNIETCYPLAFQGSKLKEVRANSKIKAIGAGAFAYMPNLREIVFPATLTDLSGIAHFAKTSFANNGECDDRQFQPADLTGTVENVWPESPAIAYIDISKVKGADLTWNYDYTDRQYLEASLPFTCEGITNMETWESHIYKYTGPSRLIPSNTSNYGVTNPLRYMSHATLVYMPQGISSASMGEEAKTNIITTTDGTTYQCEDLRLYDYASNGNYDKANNWLGQRTYYAIPHKFTARKAALKRIFTNGGAGKKFTVCLPFAVSATEFGTFYEFKKFDKEKGELTFSPVTTATTKACTPYLFMPKSADVELTATDVAVSQVADGIVETGDYTKSVVTLPDGSQFIGVYEYHTVPDGFYNFTNDNFRKVLSGKAFVAPFRAYFNLNTAGSAAKALTAFYEETATGISSREPLNDAIDTLDGHYYNLNGQRVENPRGGVFIHNGRKVVIK